MDSKLNIRLLVSAFLIVNLYGCLNPWNYAAPIDFSVTSKLISFDKENKYNAYFRIYNKSDKDIAFNIGAFQDNLTRFSFFNVKNEDLKLIGYVSIKDYPLTAVNIPPGGKIERTIDLTSIYPDLLTILAKEDLRAEWKSTIIHIPEKNRYNICDVSGESVLSVKKVDKNSEAVALVKCSKNED